MNLIESPKADKNISATEKCKRNRKPLAQHYRYERHAGWRGMKGVDLIIHPNIYLISEH